MTTARVLTLIIVSFACSTIFVRAQTLQPSPVPPLPAPPFPTPAPVPSNINLPVSVPLPDLSGIQVGLCTLVKGHKTFTGSGYSADADFEIWRDPPLDELGLTGNRLSVSEHFYYWIDGNIHVGPINPGFQCGWDDEVAKEVLVGLDSKLKWGRDWNIETHSTPRGFRCPYPESDPRCRCKVTTFDVDLTGHLYSEGEAQLKERLTKFDTDLAQQSSFKGPSEKWWASLQQPIDVTGAGNVWLLVSPTLPSAGPISGSSTSPQTLDTNFAITVNPQIVTGSKPVPTITPLPPLEVVPDPVGFHVREDIIVSFDDFTTLLRDPRTGLIGSTFQAPRRELAVLGVKSYGSGNKGVLELQLEGRALRAKKKGGFFGFFANVFNGIRYFFEKRFYRLRGPVYVIGSPSYSSTNRSIVFADLNYDAETRKVLEKKARWVLSTGLLDTAKNASTVPLGSKFDVATNSLASALNHSVGDNAFLHSTVQPPNPEMTIISSDGIVTRILLDAAVELRVVWH